MRPHLLLLALPLLLTACGDVSSVDLPPGSPGASEYSYQISYEDPARYDDARDEPLIRRCLTLPGVTGSSVQESLPPGYSASVAFEAAQSFEDCVESLENVTLRQMTDPVVEDPDRPVSSSEICASPDLTRPAPSAGPEAPETCGELRPEDAAHLRRALEDAEPAPADVAYCLALGRSYTFRLAGSPQLTGELSIPCGPTLRDGAPVLTPEGFQELVTAAFDRAAPRRAAQADAAAGCALDPQDSSRCDLLAPPDPNGVEPDATFLRRCAGSYEGDAATADLVGLTEPDASERARARGLEVRVIARFPDCLPITKDLRDNRVNLVVRDARVLGSFRF